MAAGTTAICSCRLCGLHAAMVSMSWLHSECIPRLEPGNVFRVRLKIVSFRKASVSELFYVSLDRWTFQLKTQGSTRSTRFEVICPSWSRSRNM